MKHKGVFEEKTVGCALAAGAVICVSSLILAWVFGVAGVYRGTYTRKPITNEITDAYTLNLLPLCLFFFVIGLLLVGGAIGYGLYRSSHEGTGIRHVEPNLRVLARYGYDAGRMITDAYEFETANRPQFYVKAMTQDGTVVDFQTTLEVYWSAGEGMVGEGEIQGSWLGRFIPYIGEAPGAPTPPNPPF